MEHIDAYFKIYYTNIQPELLNNFIKIYSAELNKILSEFNITNIQIPLIFLSKQDLDSYVKTNSISYKDTDVPSWLVGFSSSEYVCLLELNESNFNNMIKVTLHESIHYILYNLFPNMYRCKLLDEGLATYFSKQNYNYTLKQIKVDYFKDNLKTISDLLTDSSVEFANIKGYSYCYYVIHFLLFNYELTTILKWYIDINLFKEDIKKLDLDEKFTSYIKDVLEKQY